MKRKVIILIMASICLAANANGSLTTALPAMIKINNAVNLKAVKMEKEIWMPVVNYRGLYEISNKGQLRSIDRIVNRGNSKLRIKGQLRKMNINNRGYFSATLCKNGKYKNCVIHKLVAESFVSNPNNKKYVNHVDGDKTNNISSNLEWVTCSENNQHAYDIGLKIGAALGKYGKENPSSKPLFQIDKITNKVIAEWDAVHDVYRELGFNVTNIAAVCRGVRQTAYGFKWKYKI